MPWIEGIGDEVTITFTIVLGFIILLAAWFSTGIREIRFISVIIVQLTRHRTRGRNAAQSPSENETAQSQPNQVPGEGALVTPVEGIDQSDSNTETRTESPAESAEKNSGSADNTIKSEETLSAEVAKDSNDQRNPPGIEEVGNTIETAAENENDETINRRNNRSPQGNTSTSNEVKNLTEQELRQRRLEFFIGGSQNSFPKVDTRTLDSTDERSDINDCENIPVNSNKDTHAESVQYSNPGDSSSQPESSVDPVDTVTPGGTEDQSNSRTGSQSNEQSSDKIRVRIKFFNDELRHVTCSLTDTIGSFRRAHFSAELSESKLVRFIFNGQDLRNDSSTLQSYNIMDNSVLHCLVTQPRQQEHQSIDDEDSLDMGLFMFPLFGLLLAIVWYMRFMYRQFFNVTSTLTLGGISFLYLAALLSTFQGQRQEHID